MCDRLVMRVGTNVRDPVVCEAGLANPPPSREQFDREYERLSHADRRAQTQSA